MEDIAPQLIESVTAEFRNAYENSDKIQRLLEAVQQGTATYEEAREYSLEVSRLIGQAYEKYISSASLPDGAMYYNIASRLVPSTVDENYRLVADYAEAVQKALNQKAKLGIKAQVAALDEDRRDGLVELAASAERYDEVSGKLLNAFDTFSQSVVDETIRKNVDFQGRAGLRPTVRRRLSGGGCKWCRSLVGEYTYPDVPKDVYRRHENCRCTVEYDPGDGRKQNVYTKRWTTEDDRDIIEERKRSRLNNIDTFRPNDYSGISNRLSKNTPEELLQAAKSGKRHGGVYVDATKKTPGQLKRSIISRRSQVEVHFEKIRYPEKYVADWKELPTQKQEGLLKKWQKDAVRNAEQAEIEVAVYKERFGK